MNEGIRNLSDTTNITVLVLLGSLRAASVNRQLVELALETAPESVRLQWFDRLGELPFYNQDLDTDDLPEPVAALRQAAADADAATGSGRSSLSRSWL